MKKCVLRKIKMVARMHAFSEFIMRILALLYCHQLNTLSTRGFFSRATRSFVVFGGRPKTRVVKPFRSATLKTGNRKPCMKSLWDPGYQLNLIYFLLNK